MNPSENNIQATIKDYLLYTGWLILRVNQGARVTEKKDGKLSFARFAFWVKVGADEESAGIADLLAFREGIMLAVECKTYTNKPTVKQEAFLDAWEDAGGLAVIGRGLEDVRAAIDGMETWQGWRAYEQQKAPGV